MKKIKIEGYEIDTLLLEAIEPEVEKAKSKLKKKEALKLQDIMILLLKSQFNYISHLDVSISKLDVKFNDLKENFNDLKEDFSGLKIEFKNLEIKIIEMMRKQIIWFISAIGFFAILLKVLDKIWK